MLDALSFKSVHSQQKGITNSEALKSSMTISSYFPKHVFFSTASALVVITVWGYLVLETKLPSGKSS